MSDEVFAKVKDIIIEVLSLKEEDKVKVTAEARFREELGADSLDLVELIMAFEDEFGKRISDEDARTITTVGEAVSYVEARLESGK